MHEYHGSYDGGANPQVKPHDGSAAAPTGPMPGTEPIPDAEAGSPGGSSRPRRSGSRIHAGLPSWDIRAKIAVVVSFVVLVTVLVMNRPRLKSKDSSAPVAAISQRTNADKSANVGDSAKPGDRGAPKEGSESPPAAPVAASDPTPGKGDAPPDAPEPIAAEVPPKPVESLPKDRTDEREKPAAAVAEAKEETPSLDAPTSKAGERKVLPTALADAPIPPLDDAKPKEEPFPKDEKTPRLDGRPASTPIPAEGAPKVVPDGPAAPVAAMPLLSKTPSTADPDKAVTDDPPPARHSDASNDGGFSIPSAGLVRTADSAGKKSNPGEAVVSVTATKPPASVPGTGNDDGTLHIVRRGENFWTIARYHYASGRFYKALWYANRDLAKTPEDLYVGTAIRIPPVEDLNRDLIEAPKTARTEARPSASTSARKGSPRDGRAERTAVEGEPQATLPVDRKDSAKPIPRRAELPPKPEPETSYRTYIVRGRNETLRSVARTQLGDGDRELEIEALNRDKFSEDSTRLKVGMILNLPNETRTR